MEQPHHNSIMDAEMQSEITVELETAQSNGPITLPMNVISIALR